ncbi:hypothetical protein BLNAU_20880 [Blattamonas nauphoetae]|uniref:Uncharacterized protein n=1 Tax=Blattamonas nauphoetae TaxID=2049346 RepID=A0ABQ9WXG8_9EUKA|nr:hypothetical protein BLNAU_20880 [Blattamonas nauphoetae]
MATTTHSMNTSTDAPLNCPQESTSIVIHLHEPFLKFDPTSDLSFEDQSKIYCSLVALVKAKCPLDDALQERAVRFLKSLRPEWGEDLAAKLITELVPSTAGSPSGFIDSIITLLSSPHSILRAAALSCLSIVDNDYRLGANISKINRSLREWTEEGQEVVQSSKQMLQALFSEGFKDTLEQMMKHDKSAYYGLRVVEECYLLSQELGSNV